MRWWNEQRHLRLGDEWQISIGKIYVGPVKCLWGLVKSSIKLNRLYITRQTTECWLFFQTSSRSRMTNADQSITRHEPVYEAALLVCNSLICSSNTNYYFGNSLFVVPTHQSKLSTWIPIQGKPSSILTAR